jgi:hypothetical protein
MAIIKVSAGKVINNIVQNVKLTGCYRGNLTTLTTNDFLPSGSNQIIIPNNTMISFIGNALAKSTNSNQVANWIIEGLVEKKDMVLITHILNIRSLYNETMWVIGTMDDPINDTISFLFNGLPNDMVDVTLILSIYST